MNEVLKNCEDYVLALLLLILSSPLMLVLAVGVKLSSSGPVFYRQRRVGWNSVEFTMYKFRTMPVEVEKESGPIWASKVDNCATKFGGRQYAVKAEIFIITLLALTHVFKVKPESLHRNTNTAQALAWTGKEK